MKADDQERDKARSVQCKSCCCEAHHQLTIHYSGNKYTEVPVMDCEGIGPGLANLVMENNVEDQVGEPKNNLGGLEEIIMSADINLDLLM